MLHQPNSLVGLVGLLWTTAVAHTMMANMASFTEMKKSTSIFGQPIAQPKGIKLAPWIHESGKVLSFSPGQLLKSQLLEGI